MPVRIAILGGPRCGKTTLIQQLYVDLKIRDINVGVATEYSTDYLRDKGMIESISEQYGIYLGQLHLEKSLDSHDYAITDYATFVPYIYGRLMLGDKTRTKKEIEILKLLGKASAMTEDKEVKKIIDYVGDVLCVCGCRSVSDEI